MADDGADVLMYVYLFGLHIWFRRFESVISFVRVYGARVKEGAAKRPSESEAQIGGENSTQR